MNEEAFAFTHMLFEPLNVRERKLLGWFKPKERLQETSSSFGRSWTCLTFPIQQTAINTEFLVKGGKFYHENIKHQY